MPPADWAKRAIGLYHDLRADRIVVLSAGRIIELGSHAELMQMDGAYARLFNLQAEGYR